MTDNTAGRGSAPHMTFTSSITRRLYVAASNEAKRQGIAVATMSKLLLKDGKRLHRLAEGSDITLRTYDRAMADLDQMKTRGVVSDFPPLTGTGPGRHARDLFSETT